MKKNVALMALTGILTLASCGQNGTTTPKTDPTAPTVSLTATPNSLTAAGDVALTANVTENESTVTKVEFYRDGTLIGTDTTSSDGFTYSDARSANGSYVYTAKATNSANLVGTSNSQTVTVNIPTTGGGGTTPPSSATITITSPANGSSVTSGTVTVNFTTSKQLTDVTCSVNGATGVAANAGPTSGTCTVNVTAANGGQANILVQGKDGTTVVQANTIVNVAIPAPERPGVVNNIGFSLDQQLRVSDRGLIGEIREGNVYRNQESGWRVLAQTTSTPSNPNDTLDTYVKGKNVSVTFTNPGGAGTIEAFHARTTGTDVPRNDQIQAADRIGYAANAGSLTFNLDATRFSEFEGVRQWIVIRVNGTQLYYRPIVTDNTAPQAAVPDFVRANNANSNTLEVRQPDGSTVTYARGQIEIFTTNRSIQDQPFGEAPAGSPFNERRPAGLESITYYLVPEGRVAGNSGVSDADLTRRAAAIKNIGTASTPRFATTEGGADTTDYRATFNTPSVTDGTYRVYAITRDQLGNEVASPTYDRVIVDNTGPSAAGVTLCDASPLPFISTEPCRFISDVAVLSIGGFNDTGVGLDDDTYNFNLGGTPLIGNGTFSPFLTDIADGLFLIDTNNLPDGELAFNFTGVTDRLGNPLSPEELARLNANRITIDNTDPSIEINRPNGGQFRSGEEITVEIKASDRTSGVYQNVAFWDDSFVLGDGAQEGPLPGQISRPVELGRVTADTPTSYVAEITNNPRMTAPFIATLNPVGIQQFYTTAIATDKAGNATMRQVPVNVLNKYVPGNSVGVLNTPSIGAFDGYNRTEVRNPQPGVGVQPFADNGTSLLRPTSLRLGGVASNRDSLTLLQAGTAARSIKLGTTGAETIKTVNTYGEFDLNDWNTIKGYLLGNGFGQADAAAAATAQRDLAVANLANAARLAANDRTLTTDEFNNLVRLGASAQVLRDVTADGRFSDVSDAPNPNDVEAVVASGRAVFNEILTITLGNLTPFFSDPSLARAGSGAQLRQSRVEQRWSVTNQPWLKLGDTATPSDSRYTVTTNGLNNLYWNMQDDVASSYPSSTYSYLPTFFSAFGLRASYSALAGVVMDTAGAYNYYGEQYQP